jgi:4-amino-4-deoxy-L-arabinose transferase-like glycosyltransferase
LIKATVSLPESPINTRELIALALIILIALLVRLPGMAESLWFDEIWYTKTMFEDPVQLDFLLWKDVHPPVYALSLLAWTDLFGDSEIAVRLPSLLFGLLSLALLWFMTRRWLAAPRALLVTALMALSTPHIWYSYENKVNMMLLLFILSTLWLYWRANETRNPRDWIMASFMMILSLHTHAYAVPVGAAIYAWLTWRACFDRSLFKPIILSGLIVAMAFAPMAMLKYGQLDDLARGYLRQLSPGELYKLLLVWLPSGNTLRTIGPYSPFARLTEQPWAFFLIDAFFAFVLARGLWIMGRKARGDGWLKPANDPVSTESARLILLWFALPLVFTVVGSIISRDFYIERNLIVMLPPFLMLLIAGASVDPPRWLNIAMLTGLMVMALAATVSLHFIKSETWTVYKYKPDWRSAMHYFSNESQGKNTPLILVTAPAKPIAYYHRRLALAGTPIGPKKEPLYGNICGTEPERVLQNVSRIGYSTFYLVHNKTWGGCWKSAWETVSDAPQLHLAERRDFKGLSVYKFILNR